MYFKTFSSSHSEILFSQGLLGFSSNDLISDCPFLKFKFGFLQKIVLMSSILWVSSNSISSGLISPHSPVIPKEPSLRYLPALPAICAISDNLSLRIFLPSNFFILEKKHYLNPCLFPYQLHQLQQDSQHPQIDIVVLVNFLF